MPRTCVERSKTAGVLVSCVVWQGLWGHSVACGEHRCDTQLLRCGQSALSTVLCGCVVSWVVWQVVSDNEAGWWSRGQRDRTDRGPMWAEADTGD